VAQEPQIVWNAYLQYRARTRGFELAAIEGILRSSRERYYDTSTLRHVVIGNHRGGLVMIPYEKSGM
jgi:hypothetical protein